MNKAASVIEALAADNARLREALAEYRIARSAMLDAGVMGCRCDRDDVTPGQCFQCLFLYADDIADAALHPAPEQEISGEA